MNITKIETNLKRRMFLHESNSINFKEDASGQEMKVLNVYPTFEYQELIGFGGAFTESTCYNIISAKNGISDKILDEYFGENGLNYNICRLPIASTDFSLSSYSYSNNASLDDFSIYRDKEYVIPVIKMAQNRNTRLQFLSSPWSPPAFMKNNKRLTKGGQLLDIYKETWSKYILKYILSYKELGINISYITIQNEPNAVQEWESCIYSPEKEIDLLVNYLRPILDKNNINTKLLIWDHNKEKLFNRTFLELNNTMAVKAVDGIAFHWYSGDHFENIELIRQVFPDKLLIHTEGCTGYSNFRISDEFFNAEMYAHDIIGDLNAGVNAFIDWNMVLDYIGGPNHKQNYCNSPIMLNKTNDDYIKNLTFYYIGHFSKYIQPGSKRIAFSKYSKNIEMTAFKNPDKSIVVVLLNSNDKNIEYNFCINGQFFQDNLDSHAIVTFIIK